MSQSSDGESDSQLTMVPTEVPTDVEGDRASLVGDRTPEEPTVVPEHLNPKPFPVMRGP